MGLKICDFLAVPAVFQPLLNQKVRGSQVIQEVSRLSSAHDTRTHLELELNNLLQLCLQLCRQPSGLYCLGP